MKRAKSIVVFGGLLGLLLVAGAAPIAITNPSFEDGTGWTFNSGGFETLPNGSFFPYAAPDGARVRFFWGDGQYATQVLSETLAAKTIYTMQMEFCRRSDAEGPITSWLILGYGAGGYTGGGTILKKIVSGDAGAPIPAQGTYETWTLSYETGASPAGLGEVLWIMVGPNDAFNDGSAGYDNVRLDRVPVSSGLIVIFQ